MGDEIYSRVSEHIVKEQKDLIRQGKQFWAKMNVLVHHLQMIAFMQSVFRVLTQLLNDTYDDLTTNLPKVQPEVDS